MTLVPSLLNRFPPSSIFFFFNDTATTEIYTLSLHDALPIYVPRQGHQRRLPAARRDARHRGGVRGLPRPLRGVPCLLPWPHLHRQPAWLRGRPREPAALPRGGHARATRPQDRTPPRAAGRRHRAA